MILNVCLLIFPFILMLHCLDKLCWINMGLYAFCNQCRATKTSRSLKVYTHSSFYFWVKAKLLSLAREYIHSHTATYIQKRLEFRILPSIEQN